MNFSDKTKLGGADLSDADLRGAYLRGANLRGSDLGGADLSDANLHGADFDDSSITKHALAKLKIVRDGDIIGWKKCERGELVKLLIPKEAARSNGAGRKCRAEFAKVLEITSPDGKTLTEAVSGWKLRYMVGEMVYPDRWDSNPWKECSHGIHFFITREEAENYVP